MSVSTSVRMLNLYYYVTNNMKQIPSLMGRFVYTIYIFLITDTVGTHLFELFTVHAEEGQPRYTP